MQTNGAAALEWITARIAEGRTVYLSTMTRSTAISPKTFAKWEAMGRPVVKLSASGDLLIASGKHYLNAKYSHLSAI